MVMVVLKAALIIVVRPFFRTELLPSKCRKIEYIKKPHTKQRDCEGHDLENLFHISQTFAFFHTFYSLNFLHSLLMLPGIWWDVVLFILQLVSGRKTSPPLAILRHLRFEQLSDYSVCAENGSRVKYRASVPHYSFMALLPTQPAMYLHVNLIIWPLALWSNQIAKVSCLLTSDVLFDAEVCVHTHILYKLNQEQVRFFCLVKKK